MTKLIVSFRNFVNAPNNLYFFFTRRRIENKEEGEGWMHFKKHGISYGRFYKNITVCQLANKFIFIYLYLVANVIIRIIIRKLILMRREITNIPNTLSAPKN
jgi:hypothetical protein